MTLHANIEKRTETRSDKSVPLSLILPIICLLQLDIMWQFNKKTISIKITTRIAIVSVIAIAHVSTGQSENTPLKFALG